MSGVLSILVVDDDPFFAEIVRDVFSGPGYRLHSATTGEEGVRISGANPLDIVLLDQKLPDGFGDQFCPRILAGNPLAKIIIITGYPQFDYVVSAIRAGACDFLSKPISVNQLKTTVANAVRLAGLERIERVHNYYSHKEQGEAALVGSGLRELRGMLEMAASVSAPVLITGETGTGKSVAATCIHYASKNKSAPFIPFNCANLPESLIEMELFGHVKGAFTGAVGSSEGLFGMAEGGTILLDEISEMPFHLQSKLLSVLETHTIKRIGSSYFSPVRVRVIAACNSDIEKDLGTKFRQDLYYRLSVIRIHIPPLRERPGDIKELSEYFLSGIAGSPRIEPDEMEKLMQYNWPGNVRELKNLLERAIILQKGPVLRPSVLLYGQPPREGQAKACALRPTEEQLPPMTLEEMEKRLISEAITRNRGNLTKACEELGTSYSTLRRKIILYRLNGTRVAKPTGGN